MNAMKKNIEPNALVPANGHANPSSVWSRLRSGLLVAPNTDGGTGEQGASGQAGPTGSSSEIYGRPLDESILHEQELFEKGYEIGKASRRIEEDPDTVGRLEAMAQDEVRRRAPQPLDPAKNIADQNLWEHRERAVKDLPLVKEQER